MKVQSKEFYEILNQMQKDADQAGNVALVNAVITVREAALDTLE